MVGSKFWCFFYSKNLMWEEGLTPLDVARGSEAEKDDVYAVFVGLFLLVGLGFG
jgi:hypothetical protein